MKANHEIYNYKWVGRCCAGLAVAGLALLPGSLAAQVKGATQLMQHKTIRTVQDAEAVPARDTMVMSCPKCKDSSVTVVQKSSKTGVKPDFITVQRHECPGCEQKYVSHGQGKQATTKIVHVCKKCGSEDALCCVMKKGEGATAGMEKE